MDSQNHHIVTVIDPEGCDIRLRPSQILEIVILDNNTSLIPTITKGSCGIQYIETLVVSTQRTFPVPSKSYFFKLGKPVESWPAGTYNGGCVVLADKNKQYAVFIQLKIKNKDRTKIFFPKQDENMKSYQEVDLLPKQFLNMEDGCVVKPTWRV